jgi:hypothetical protein
VGGHCRRGPPQVRTGEGRGSIDRCCADPIPSLLTSALESFWGVEDVQSKTLLGFLFIYLFLQYWGLNSGSTS